VQYRRPIIWLFVFSLVAVTLIATGCPSAHEASDLLEAKYFETLDDWVFRGGPIDEVQNTVVATCGKLVMSTASLGEMAALTTTQREEFHFRVDVCTTMTVNRVHPQPEFEKEEIVRGICEESKVGLFRKLCTRIGEEARDSRRKGGGILTQSIIGLEDEVYNYSFQIPKTWTVLRKPAPGDPLRFLIQTPNKSTVGVAVSVGDKDDTLKYLSDKTRMKQVVDAMIQHTFETRYRPGFTQHGMSDIKVIQTLDLSDEDRIQFRIDAVGRKEPNSVALSGIHTAPFGKNYIISMIVTSTAKSAKFDGESLKNAVNSFRLNPD